LDRLGLRYQGDEYFFDHWSRHRQVMPLTGIGVPDLGQGAFVAPSAAVIGDVDLGPKASVWYNTVIRGDVGSVKVGEETNIQDGVVIQASTFPGFLEAEHKDEDDHEVDVVVPKDVTIGRRVTIGHGAMIYASTIGDHALVGINAVVGEGATVESKAMVAANAVVAPQTVVPARQLWAGNPAAYVRDLTEEEVAYLDTSATNYMKLASEHSAACS